MRAVARIPSALFLSLMDLFLAHLSRICNALFSVLTLFMRGCYRVSSSASSFSFLRYVTTLPDATDSCTGPSLNFRQLAALLALWLGVCLESARPGFGSHFPRGAYTRSSHTSGLEVCTPAAALPGARRLALLGQRWDWSAWCQYTVTG